MVQSAVQGSPAVDGVLEADEGRNLEKICDPQGQEY